MGIIAGIIKVIKSLIEQFTGKSDFITNKGGLSHGYHCRNH